MMMTIILEAALRALALALVVALALGLLRVKNVPAQRAAWTVVLLSAVAMPLLMRCTWLPSQLTWMPTLPLLREDAPITPQNQATSTVRFSVPSSNLRIVHRRDNRQQRQRPRRFRATEPRSQHASCLRSPSSIARSASLSCFVCLPG